MTKSFNGKTPAHANVSEMTPAQIVEKGNRRHKRRFWTVVLVVALVAFVGSVGSIAAINYSYKEGQQKYDEITAIAEFEYEGQAIPEDVSKLKVDWDALRAVNPDVVAWVYIPGTVINYPVVQGKDDEYYLTVDFDGDQGWLANYGAIFMEAKNKPDWSDTSYFIFGHHMNDGSMFADIVGLENQERFDECRTVYLLSPSGNFKLRTYSLVHCASDDPLVVTGFKSKKERAEYVQDKMDRSVVKVSDAPDADEVKMTFGFATCDSGSGGRDVLFAYVEDTSAEGLEGKIGIKKTDGQASGFKEDLIATESEGE